MRLFATYNIDAGSGKFGPVFERNCSARTIMTLDHSPEDVRKKQSGLLILKQRLAARAPPCRPGALPDFQDDNIEYGELCTVRYVR
jgi:hypothetical protein